MTHISPTPAKVQCDGRPGTSFKTCPAIDTPMEGQLPNGWLAYRDLGKVGSMAKAKTWHMCNGHTNIMRRGEFTFAEWVAWLKKGRP